MINQLHFIEFLLSEGAQKINAKANNEFPLDLEDLASKIC